MKLGSGGQGDRRSIANDKGNIGAYSFSLHARLGSEMLGSAGVIIHQHTSNKISCP
jgi:hypothetical protein